MTGYIKLHRSLMDYEWYGDVNTTMLFIHLLLKANHTVKTWKGITVNVGQLITGRKQLALEIGISEQSIRTSLNRLKSTNQLTIKTTNKYSIITIHSYDKFQQSNQQANHQLTNKQPATNQQLTTTNKLKNDKNVKNEKKINKFSVPTKVEVAQYCTERNNAVDADKFIDYYTANGWKVGKNPMKDWRAAIRTWEKNGYNQPKRETTINDVDWGDNVIETEGVVIDG